MEAPQLFAPREIAKDVFVIPGAVPIPGAGVLAINALLIRGKEPMLVDTGIGALKDDFLRALGQLIDFRDLKRVFLSHADIDHLGAYDEVMALAPNARAMIGFLGMAKLQLLGRHVERVDVIAPGDRIDLGDRQLAVRRPPYFDAPETLSFFDPASRTLFTADAFGALLGGAHDDAGDIAAQDLAEGMAAWSALDAPWLELTDSVRYAAVLAALNRLEPAHVVSSHLPPSHDIAGLGAHALAAASRLRGPVLAAA